MKIKSKDLTSYYKDDKERIARVVEFDCCGIRFIVHRHIYYPETWLLKCMDLGIEFVDLKTNDMQEAFHNAKIYMMGAIDGQLVNLENARKALEESEEISL